MKTLLPSSDQQLRRVAETEEELARLRTQIEERERDLPLRERIKNIFKRYGFTVGAIFLAIGTKIGVIVNALTNGRKAVSEGVGNGLKRSWKKDWSTSSWIDWFNREFHRQNCRSSCWIPWQKCLVLDSCCCSFHG